MIPSFTFSRTPVLHFGPGKFSMLGDIISGIGNRILIITGTHSFASSEGKDILDQTLSKKSVKAFYVSLKGEPSPDFVDDTVSRFNYSSLTAVCAIGGGSVMDEG